MTTYAITNECGGWRVWTVPDHTVVSRAFATPGEAEAEVCRIEAFMERHAEHMAYVRDELSKEMWR